MNPARLAEIQDINLAYLMLAQNLIREDKATAMVRLKVDAEAADILAGLSGPEMMKLARTNQLICHLGHQSAKQLKVLISKKRDPSLSSIHASLLMASAACGEGLGNV